MYIIIIVVVILLGVIITVFDAIKKTFQNVFETINGREVLEQKSLFNLIYLGGFVIFTTYVCFELSEPSHTKIENDSIYILPFVLNQIDSPDNQIQLEQTDLITYPKDTIKYDINEYDTNDYAPTDTSKIEYYKETEDIEIGN